MIVVKKDYLNMHTTHTYGRYLSLFSWAQHVSQSGENYRLQHTKWRAFVFFIIFPRMLIVFLYVCSPQEISKLTFLIIQLKNENASG